ncbi:MAG: MarR family transcriptional regulator [Alphaproteobacteria bacterium]|nr:MarR family transcriptional regulator [Alphaproteobacteria bacterium]|tara:strand:- start:664 stop:1176 length:513 start_codon:yes stop_codon:yes gene_type:complete
MPQGTNSATSDFETGLTNDDRLDLRTWLRLLTCANLIEGEVRKRLRDEFDITLARFDLLAQLVRADRGLSMGELSRRLMVTNGNVTALIDRLVGEKLVERRADPDDRRAQIIEITSAGRRSFDRMSAAHADWITDLFGDLGRSELEALHASLANLKSSLAAARPSDRSSD